MQRQQPLSSRAESSGSRGTVPGALGETEPPLMHRWPGVSGSGPSGNNLLCVLWPSCSWHSNNGSFTRTRLALKRLCPTSYCLCKRRSGSPCPPTCECPSLPLCGQQTHIPMTPPPPPALHPRHREPIDSLTAVPTMWRQLCCKDGSKSSNCWRESVRGVPGRVRKRFPGQIHTPYLACENLPTASPAKAPLKAAPVQTRSRCCPLVDE